MMKNKKDYIILFIILFLVIIISILGNEYIGYEHNLVSEIHEYKCEIVDVIDIDGNKCDIIVKTNTNEYYTIDSNFDFYNDINTDDNYHKCRVIERYHRNKLYDTLIILIF